jgi:hypothetical protein
MLPDGDLFAYAVNLGLDTVNPFELRSAQDFSKDLALSPDGTWLPAKISKSGDTIAIFDISFTLAHRHRQLG